MKTVCFILFCLTFGFSSFGQIDGHVYCFNQKYDVYKGVAWQSPGQNCKYRMYGSEHLSNIPARDTSVINKIKSQIKLRAGSTFYNSLVIKAITISKPRGKCNNIKYTLRYIYRIDSSFLYRFSLSYDKKGDLVGNNAFPSISTNPSFFELSPVCNSIDTALSDSTFAKFYQKVQVGKIQKVQIDYDIDSDSFIYVIYGVTLFDGERGNAKCVSGWWKGKNVIINAQSCKKIRVEDSKEYKTVTFM